MCSFCLIFYFYLKKLFLICACRCVHVSANAHSGRRRAIPGACLRPPEELCTLNSWGNSLVLVVLLLQWYIMLCLYRNIVCTHVCVLSIKSKTAGMLLKSLFVLLNLSWCNDSAYHLPPQQSILVWPMTFWSCLLLLLLIKATAIYLVICEYIFDFLFQHIRKLLTLCINMNVKNLVSWSKNLQQSYGSSGEACCYLRRLTLAILTRKAESCVCSVLLSCLQRWVFPNPSSLLPFSSVLFCENCSWYFSLLEERFIGELSLVELLLLLLCVKVFV